MKYRRKGKNKTPLQEWAWNRYRLKGNTAFVQNNLRQLFLLEDTTFDERFHLNKAILRLDNILKKWDEQHLYSRKRRERHESQTTK